MKSIDFIVILATMAHPNKWTIVKLKNAFIRECFLDRHIPDVTLASAQTLRLAFLKISDI